MQHNILSLAAAAVLAVAAQAEVVELGTIEVTASERTAVRASEVTSNVTVITEEAIEESRAATLEEALVRLGGIAMTSNGGPGTATSFYLRGFDSKRTLVLIDGVRYNDVTGLSGAQFPFIHLDDVKQIEIIKGAQSGVWGADASAGVINIVTKSAGTGTHLDMALEGGSFDTRKGSLRVSHKAGRFDLLAGVSRYTTDGFSAAEPKHGTEEYGQRGDELGWEKDGYRNTTYSAKLGLDLSGKDRLEAGFRRIAAYYEYDWTGADAATNSEEADNRFYTASYRHDGELHRVSLQYSLSDFNRRTTDYTGSVEEMSLQDRIGYGEADFLRIGGSYQKFEHLNSYGAVLDKSYDARSAFATNYNKFGLFAAGQTILTESLRYDRYSDFDDKTTGKIGLKQFVHRDLYIGANYGTGYNVPRIGALYGPWGANPDLKPETTESFDVTVGNDVLTLTWFDNRITDMIEWDDGYNNLAGTSKLRGAELGYEDVFAEAFLLRAGYTWLDAKNSAGDFLARRPKHQIDAAVTWYATEALDIGVNGQYIGERYDGHGKTGAQTGKYTVLNAVANYRIDENLALYGKIDNLTDRYYQTVDGYATAERSFYLGLTARY
jgi:vitamin B12 transporter